MGIIVAMLLVGSSSGAIAKISGFSDVAQVGEDGLELVE
jgi:hypothetical protein